MTIEYPRPGEPRRPFGPRDPGDAWVVADDGQRYWGRFGAAGLLAFDHERGVLLQHRVSWSHHGDTWALPGGARHEHESARAGALREAQEEAGVPDGAVRARFESVLDLDVWSYVTVVGDVVEPFDPVISDPESVALEWVAPDEVTDRPLHPAFAAAWPRLRAVLPVRPALVVDAANVVGSVPDGWWRDRAGAAGRLISALADLARAGMDASSLGLNVGESGADGSGADGSGPIETWFPEVTVVIEGAARAAGDHPDLRVVRAPGEGDDTIVAEARRLVQAGDTVTVVTSDRALTERCVQVGAVVHGTRWLRERLDAHAA